jgi:hypothetical protein
VDGLARDAVARGDLDVGVSLLAQAPDRPVAVTVGTTYSISRYTWCRYCGPR